MDLTLRVQSLGQSRLTEDECEELREVLADELVDSGLRPNDETNEYGRTLDEVVRELRFAYALKQGD